MDATIEMQLCCKERLRLRLTSLAAVRFASQASLGQKGKRPLRHALRRSHD